MGLAMLGEVGLDDAIGPGKGELDVAIRKYTVVWGIARHRLVGRWLTGVSSVLRVYDSRQGIIIHLD
jgi:hypothetical protein